MGVTSPLHMTWPHESSERDLRVPWLLCRLSSWSKQTSGQLILRRIPAAPGSSPGSASFSPLRTTMDRHYKWTAVLLPDPSRLRLILRRTPAPPSQSGSSPGSPGTAASGSNISSSRTPFRVVCSSSPGSHLGPPAGPAPEPKWKKNLRLLMKRRDQAGSRGSRRGAVDEDPPHLFPRRAGLLCRVLIPPGSSSSGRSGPAPPPDPSPPVSLYR
ncbi:translation initiation factor IF-2-like isoform X1 [Gymnodraco acuticeps]|uniref:Translation initiation factor IF-2-like isoform X1 n=1 Tax=Gymnodraco acuticeps TaxID=8218 RepID=A0A6P8UB54_GYMAC|nr:translation initiation factor IF-2-like isoform X1 [Gymnodraco acuticeps]XP_034074030.1 translation initiation factor IF-2-like isoform X1 [Gymnodraco acuticeps]XP_034074032.1 translation initiation factor IF-2-like isoform X1 [Gymnodraco acuticeps]XP_034074033.1 translation initiation factor IF-2-like isoform X1 [Gymnodraco acuticeps]